MNTTVYTNSNKIQDFGQKIGVAEYYDYLEKWNSSDLYEEYYSGWWNNTYPTKLNGVVKMSIRNIFKCYKGRPFIKKDVLKKLYK